MCCCRRLFLQHGILQASNCLYTVPEWFATMQQQHQTKQTLVLRASTSCKDICQLCLTKIILLRHTKSTDMVVDKAFNNAGMHQHQLQLFSKGCSLERKEKKKKIRLHLVALF